jgi:hypothetical protein
MKATRALDRSWKAMTWDGAKHNSVVLGSQMSLAEKVAWLESADHTAERLKSAKKKPAAQAVAPKND